MMKFRYTDKDSPVHQLNPLTKLAWVMSLTVLTFILDHPLALLCLFLVTLLPVISAGIRREWASFMKFSLFLCLTIIIINVLFSYHGAHVLWKMPVRIPVVGVPQITLEAIVFGLSMSLRLLTLISAFTIFSLTVHPDDILQSMLKLKVPYKSVLVASLSTRFVPLLMDDAGRIRDLQRSRGLETDRGNILRRIKNQAAVLVPLLSNSLDRTVQLAEAMEARGFGSGHKRSFYKPLKLTGVDRLALTVSLLPVPAGILLRWWGEGVYQYYPSLGKINYGLFEWSMLAFVFCSLSLIIPLGQIKKRRAFD
jgi:energy-coupling factor transport system permease protein